jgi:hypothetical protein
MDSARGVDVGFLVSVVERWRGATLSGVTRSRPGSTLSNGPDDFSDLDMLAGSEFSRMKTDTVPAAPIPPPAQPVAGPRPSTMTPDAYFFPVDQPGRQPFQKARK